MKRFYLLLFICFGFGMVFCHDAWSKPAGVLLQEGIYQQETTGNLDKAIEIYQQVLVDAQITEPVAAQANYQLGLCYLKKDEKDKAAEFFQQVVTGYPKQEGLVSKANQELKKLRSPQEVVEQAVMTISTCTESDPRVAQALASLHGLKEEVAVVELAKYLDSETATVRRSAIFILWKGEFKNIGPAVSKLQKLCSHSEDFTRGMAAIALGAAKHDASYETLCTMTLKDGSGYARRCAAYALGLLGRMEAKPVLEKALQDTDSLVSSNAKMALTMLAESPGTGSEVQSAEELSAEGWKLWGKQKFSEAEKLFQKAVEKDASMENAWNGLGWSQFNQGKPQAAQKAFEECVKLNPRHPAALNGLGWIAKGRGNKEEAIEYWRKAVEAAPNATAALNGLANTSMEMGKYDDAAKYYEQWLKAEPEGREAKKGSEKAKQQQEQVKPAIAAAQEWLALVDGGQYEKSWDEAAKYFQKALTKNQWSQSLNAVRKPLGAVKERKVLSSMFTTQAPGAPDGKYVIIQFQSSFENKASAVETVTPMLDSDGAWRVSGYYIR